MAKIFRPTKRQLPPAEVLEVTRLSSEGQGIAKRGKATVFVENALPGETVKAEFTDVRGQFLQAKAKSWQVTSPLRTQPQCQYFGQCGGCEWQHISSSEQIQLKQQQLLDALQRHAQLEPELIESAILSPHWHYRSRARLSVWRNPQKQWALGFRALASKQIVPIDECNVLVRELGALIPVLNHWLSQSGASSKLGHIELMRDDFRSAILIRVTQALSDREVHSLLSNIDATSVDLWLQAENSEPECITRPGNPLYRYSLTDFDVSIEFGVQDFTQVNAQVNRLMVSQALRWLSGATGDEAGRLGRVLDLFCGVGNFSIPIAAQARSVVGIELIDAMVGQAKQNAAQNGMENALFVGADLSRDQSHSPWLAEGFDAVLLDPPRSGAREALDFIKKLRVPTLVYVSCNPATLVRDASILRQQGYRLAKLSVMDMFPQTKHTEAMALFTLR